MIASGKKVFYYKRKRVDDKIKDYIQYKLNKAAMALKEANLLYENQMYEQQ